MHANYKLHQKDFTNLNQVGVKLMRLRHATWYVCGLALMLLMSASGVHAIDTNSTETPKSDVFINEVMNRGEYTDTNGVTQTDPYIEFVELYNATDEVVDITDWQLEYKSGAANIQDEWESKLLSGQDGARYIEPRSVYLIATSNFVEASPEHEIDLKLSSGSRRDGGYLRLVQPSSNSNDGRLIDVIRWGDAEQIYEGNDEPAPVHQYGQSLTRCFEDRGPMSNDENRMDFRINETPDPGSKTDCSDRNSSADNRHGNESGCSQVRLSEVLPNPAETTTTSGFIELHNQGRSTVNLSDCGLQVESEGGMSRGPYWLAGIELEPDAYHVVYEDSAANIKLFTTVSASVRLLDADKDNQQTTTYPQETVHQKSSWARFEDDWHNTQTPTPGDPNGTQDTSGDDKEPESTAGDCNKVVISEILSNPGESNSGAFIELYNPETEALNVTGCGLQVQSGGGVLRDVYQLSSISIESEGYHTVYEQESELDLFSTVSATVYWLDHQGNELQVVTHPALSQSVSWAWFGHDSWEETYAPTPGNRNQEQDRRPCPDGQYRHQDTKRCRNIDSSERELVPCDDHQYRHPETNRCRNIESSDNDLVPCEDHQYRNPETNRCRNIESATSDLVPCEEHQYRHPETNRCRTSTVENAEAIEQVEDVEVIATGTPTNWWFAAGLLALAAGYAGWEWRHDLRNWYYLRRFHL